MEFNWDQHETHSVSQGEFKCSDDPGVVFSTILGSCVCACIFDEEQQLGGLNHFLLPGSSNDLQSKERYGAYAMEVLINELLKKGASRSNLAAKLFGGGVMLQNQENIGELNSRFAINYLKSEGIPCVSDSLGGRSARRIHFHPASGRARQFIVPPNKTLDAAVIAPQAAPAKGNDVNFF